MSGFWRNWMSVCCWAVALFGLIFVGAAAEATSGPTRLFFRLIGAPDLDLDPTLRFTLAVLGAVTLGWSLTLMAFFQAAHQLGRPLWRQALGFLLVWYVIDSGLSLATGFPLNAVSNTAVVLALLVPILRSGVLRRA